MLMVSSVTVDPGLAAVLASIVITFGGALIPLIRRNIRRSKGQLNYPKGIHELLCEILAKTSIGRVFVISYHYTNCSVNCRQRGLRIEGMFSMDYETVIIGAAKVTHGYANSFCHYFSKEVEHLVEGGEDLECQDMKNPTPIFEKSAGFYLSRNCLAFYALPVRDPDENVINLIGIDFLHPCPPSFDRAKDVLKEYRDRLTPLLKGAKY